MSAWRQIASRYRSIFWVVILAVFSLTAIPTHLHYHHEVDSGTTAQHIHGLEGVVHTPQSHTHVVDYHVLAGSSTDDDHSAVHIFKALPDVLARKITGDHDTDVLFGLVATLLPLPVRQTVSSPIATPQFVYQPPDHLSPPLRAPPQV